MRLVKIDLLLRSIVWTSSEINCSYEMTDPCITYDGVCIFGNNGTLYVFNEQNGELKATVILGMSAIDIDEIKPVATTILYNRGNLYWGNSRAEDTEGIICFNLDRIDYTKDPHAEQLIIPEQIPDTVHNGSVRSMVIEEDILYYLTKNTEYQAYSPEVGASYLVAYNLTESSKKWQKEIRGLKGTTPLSISIVNNNIYVFDSDLFCFNKQTGEKVWGHVQTYEELKTVIALSGSWLGCGVSYQDGLFYSTTAASYASASTTGLPESSFKNIICVDAENGNFVWGDLDETSGSIGSRPMVANGKCFVVAYNSLRVYDAVQGALLGVDRSVHTRSFDSNIVFNNEFIFFNYDQTNKKGILTAIRTN